MITVFRRTWDTGAMGHDYRYFIFIRDTILAITFDGGIRASRSGDVWDVDDFHGNSDWEQVFPVVFP